MPEDLLLDLETSPSVVGNLENIEHLLPVVVREVTWALKGMKGSAIAFQNAWRRIVLDVARGRTVGIQATRPQLLSAFEKRLSLLKNTHALAAWLADLDRPAVPDAAILLPEIDGMERLKANVFDHWKTTDDLEDLAARDYPLTTADLDEIGPHRRPPESFYAEESKPF